MASVNQIQERLKNRQCIDCGKGNMPEEGHSGFWKHRCKSCEKTWDDARLATQRTAKGETGPERSKRIIDEGVANLDRLMGIER